MIKIILILFCSFLFSNENIFNHYGFLEGKLDYPLITSILENQNSIYFTTSNGIVKYSNNNFELIKNGNYDQNFEVYSFSNLLVDDFNNIIFKNTQGIGIYNNKWQYLTKNKYPFLYFNGDYHFKEDTLIIKIGASARFAKIVYDSTNKNYNILEENIDVFNGNERFMINSNWCFDENYNIICDNYGNSIDKINYNDLSISSLSDNYEINFKNIKFFKFMKYIHDKLILASINNDNSVSIFILYQNNTFKEYKIINEDNINLPAEFNDLILYNDYIIVSAGYSQFLIIDINSGDINKIKKPNEYRNNYFLNDWFITSLYIDSNDELWIGSYQEGLFSVNINKLINKQLNIKPVADKVQEFVFINNTLYFKNRIPEKIDIINLLGKILYSSKVNNYEMFIPDFHIEKTLFIKAHYHNEIIFERIK